MEWTDIVIEVPRKHAEEATAIATRVSQSGLYIEDYADLEQQVLEIARIDLIEQELLDKPRDIIKIHLYLSGQDNLPQHLEELNAMLQARDIPYSIATIGVQQEEWETSWKKHYHPIEVGSRLLVCPSWEIRESDRVILQLDPGMAFGTGTHETTFLCLEVLDKVLQGGERVLDIGTGSGILGVAALLLGAKQATGIDIDPMCVRTASENAALNKVQDRFIAQAGDLAQNASGRYDIITANIVAAAIIRLAPEIKNLLAEKGLFIASGIIDQREEETVSAIKDAGLAIVEVRRKNGWSAVLCALASPQKE